MAAIESRLRRAARSRLLRRMAGLIGGMLAASGARAVDLPEDRAEALYHLYSGGGVTASGPALLVRKSMSDRLSLGASLYVDSVSNASIDVVTTASPYRETRTEYGFSGDYVYRDSKITAGVTSSHEPDYTANTVSLDVAQEVFGGMTTVSLGFSRGSDKVGKHGAPEFHDVARHWQYRLGATQILTPRWILSANVEALADEGFLGSPYRVARVFGAAVYERNPRTRTGRAVKFRLLGDLGSRDALHTDYRYYTDTWDIKAHTAEIGYSRYFGERWLGDTFLRGYSQTKALFYSDNATAETTYISRNRQLSSFHDIAVGAKLAYSVGKVATRYDLKLNTSYEYVHFAFKDFTDIRTGRPYAYSASVLQLFLSATF